MTASLPGHPAPPIRTTRGSRFAPAHLGIITALALLGVAGCGHDQATARAAIPAHAPPQRSESELRELEIKFFTERAERDPTGASDLAHLGALYLARARDTGDPRDVALAEEAARHSLKNRPQRNSGATSVLQSALLAEHRFAPALELARQASAAEPDNAPLRAAVGEIEMELGHYDSARVAFSALHAPLGDLAVSPRLARWAEIQGNPALARKLLAAALASARRETSIPREQLAWYWLRVGDVEMRTGHLETADSAYRAGLVAHPNDYRLLSALTHNAALQQKWTAATEFGELAIAQTLDPATLGVLSDAYLARGDTAKSAEFAHVLDVAVLRQPGAYHRAWSLFLLDHDRHVGTVAAKIREELRTRQDIYAYDLLAWSLHKQHRDREAESAMTKALGQGTQDAQLFFHSGMIQLALGHRSAASGQLSRALAINPRFHPTQPAEARAALASLGSDATRTEAVGTAR